MKTINFEKSILNSAYGLSCIENYLLYAMITEKYNYKHLYFNSYLSFYDISIEFIENNIEYAFFKRTPRLQEIAMKNDLIIMNYYNSMDFLKNMDAYDYMAIIVDPAYIKAKYNIEAWRSDHYILISPPNSNDFYYLNDSPRDTGIISLNEIKKIHAGGYISFTLKNEISESLKIEFLNIFLSLISTNPQYFHFDLKDIIQARDILGIIRVLRRRFCEYCGIYISMDFYNDFLISLDKFYSSLEYMRIRKSIDLSKINQTFKEMQEKDIELTKKCKNKIKEYLSDGI